MRIALGLVALVGVVGIGAGCGGKPPVPKRGVVEADLGSWKFRRFQGPLLDIEVWVDGNKAEAYTASYVTDDAEKRGRVEDKDIVNVFVTKYERDEGIVRETVKLARRLASEKGYRVDEGKIGKTRALSIIGDGEAWIMWPARKHVIKVGGRGRVYVPEVMVAKYADRFPSQLPGGSLEGALPNAQGEVKKETFEYDPSNPKIDLEKYDPKKVKIPNLKTDSEKRKELKEQEERDAKDAKEPEAPKKKAKKAIEDPDEDAPKTKKKAKQMKDDDDDDEKPKKPKKPKKAKKADDD
ncbi:MAG: hypothetical protein KF773_00370 [Deltaproteobacteria bacterium]|nr:hypothetical protein [Deltaproteobacteria bacterium]